MKYILDISKRNFERFFKDKKIRFYYIFIGMLVLASTTILAYLYFILTNVIDSSAAVVSGYSTSQGLITHPEMVKCCNIG